MKETQTRSLKRAKGALGRADGVEESRFYWLAKGLTCFPRSAQPLWEKRLLPWNQEQYPKKPLCAHWQKGHGLPGCLTQSSITHECPWRRITNSVGRKTTRGKGRRRKVFFLQLELRSGKKQEWLPLRQQTIA